MNAETVNDEAKLIMHRLIARQVRSDPSIVSAARHRVAQLEQEIGRRDFVSMWKTLLDGDRSELCRRLVARDETSAWLRLSSPFAGITCLPLDDIELRRRIWKDAKRLVTMRSRNVLERTNELDQSADQNSRRLG